jgi:hypothetical protein
MPRGPTGSIALPNPRHVTVHETDRIDSSLCLCISSFDKLHGAVVEKLIVTQVLEISHH